MNAINAIRDIMKKNDITIKQLAESMTVPAHTLQGRINPRRASSLSVEHLNRITQQLGYKIVILPAAVRTTGYELDDGLEDPL